MNKRKGGKKKEMAKKKERKKGRKGRVESEEEDNEWETIGEIKKEGRKAAEKGMKLKKKDER